jgi:2-desacetyl-2-hydroxyethyl bacteriochlorophyllide A dehydrogenase
MPERHLFHLPENVSFDNGALVEPAATALHAVRQADVKAGDKVLVQGAGTIGIMAGMLAKLSGASIVMIADRKDARLQAALTMGADIAVNVAHNSTFDVAVAHGMSHGFDCVIEASGSTDLLTDSVKLVRSGGTVAVVAFYEGTVDAFDVDRIVYGDITLRGVSGSRGMFDPILNLMESGMLDLTSLITARYPLDDVERAMLDMRNREENQVKFMIENAI